MESIFLYLQNVGEKYGISIGNSNELIKTPGNNLLVSNNKKLIESIIFDLQKFEDVEIEKSNYISGEPLEVMSLYSLLSTQIDFWDSDKKLSVEELDLFADPFLNLNPGPEKVDQLHQWRSIIEILEKNDFDFYKLQYYSNENEIKGELKRKICSDFNASQSCIKSVFINLYTIYKSAVGSWSFCFDELSEDAFATAFKFTNDFYWSIEFEISEEISELEEKNQLDENIDHYKKIKKQKSKIWFNRFLEVLNTCKKFIEISYTKDPIKEILEKGESKYIEFKETLSLDVRKQEEKSYQAKKESYIELAVLKTIAGFLNSDGGQLFIGISDKGEILGIKNELDKLHKSSKDKMQLHLKNIIKENIGSSFNNFITSDLKIIENKEIIHITCDKSDKEVFIKDKDFYIRSGPSTDKLEGKELLNYTKSRFF